MNEPTMTDTELEIALTRSPSPVRVTREEILSRISDVTYTRMNETVTICCITIDNGYSVRGESACVDPTNYNAEIGQKLAYENAFRKLWPLFGFALAERRCKSDATQGIEETIARVAHEVNRAYCAALGDDSQPPWDEAPDWQRVSAIEGARFHLDNPTEGPESSHESWMQLKLKEGWRYGDVKDADAKTHPCLVPFAELPAEQRAKDFLFRAIVHEVRRAVMLAAAER